MQQARAGQAGYGISRPSVAAEFPADLVQAPGSVVILQHETEDYPVNVLVREPSQQLVSHKLIPAWELVPPVSRPRQFQAARGHFGVDGAAVLRVDFVSHDGCPAGPHELVEPVDQATRGQPAQTVHRVLVQSPARSHRPRRGGGCSR